MAEWQLTIDCADPGLLARFWAEVLGYEIPPPPDGFDSWNDWYLSAGVPEAELDLDGDCADRLVDPNGQGPKIWFQVVPEAKLVKNRLHFDIYVSGGRTVPIEERKRRVDGRVQELISLGASVGRVVDEPEQDHYSIVVIDPEGNEFCVA